MSGKRRQKVNLAEPLLAKYMKQVDKGKISERIDRNLAATKHALATPKKAKPKADGKE